MTERMLWVAIGVWLIGLGAVCGVVLHKVRRVHLMMFAIRSDAERTRREVEVLYQQIESLEGLNRMLNLDVPLPALRGWAGSPDFLLAVARHAFSAKPVRVIECSSGASTIVLARCAQLAGRGHVFSLEHDRLYAQRTRAELASRGLEDWATVVDAPLAPCPVAGNQPWYSIDSLPGGDAPWTCWSSTVRRSRPRRWHATRRCRCSGRNWLPSASSFSTMLTEARSVQLSTAGWRSFHRCGPHDSVREGMPALDQGLGRDRTNWLGMMHDFRFGRVHGSRSRVDDRQ